MLTLGRHDGELDPPGSYRLSVDVVTDSGQTGTSAVDFTVT